MFDTILIYMNALIVLYYCFYSNSNTYFLKLGDCLIDIVFSCLYYPTSTFTPDLFSKMTQNPSVLPQVALIYVIQ